jgi:hypothetical protein
LSPPSADSEGSILTLDLIRPSTPTTKCRIYRSAGKPLETAGPYYQTTVVPRATFGK